MEYRRKTSRLLIDEHPLQVLPTLAATIGLNEAIFLQQLHYWLKGKSHERDGQLWVYNTYDGWHEQFPFWSVPTIRRVINSLRQMGLITTTDEYNRRGFDNTLWYTIEYDALSVVSDRAYDQNDQTVGSDRSDDVINVIRPIPEITSEITSETTTENSGDAAAGGGGDLKSHPAIRAYHDLYDRWPTVAQMRIIVDRDPPIREWVRAIRQWASENHKPTDIQGPLDWAFEPERMERGKGQQQRAAAAKGGSERGKYRPDEYSDIILG